jgi:A/G-specific adenine glycosylase
VLEKFEPFLKRFPTVGALAAAPEQDVLAAWSGLGYYRRARLLHACAKAIVRDFGGEVPRDVESLQELPGIGRYTAGAIASIVFNQPEPIVDGNVCRVLQRLDARPGSASEKDVIAWAWERAAALVMECSDSPSPREGGSKRRTKSGDVATPAAFNEGLMELGALVCTPAAPKCLVCPLRDFCLAREQGRVEEIPAPKARAKRSRVYHDTVVLWRKTARGVEVLLEQRPATGLWAGLWQPPALESTTRKRRTLKSLLAELGLSASASRTKPREWVFQTTHRDVCFRIWTSECECSGDANRRWIEVAALHLVGVSNAHRSIVSDILDGVRCASA